MKSLARTLHVRVLLIRSRGLGYCELPLSTVYTRFDAASIQHAIPWDYLGILGSRSNDRYYNLQGQEFYLRHHRHTRIQKNLVTHNRGIQFLTLVRCQ